MNDLDWFQLEGLYEEAQKLFLQGKQDKALDCFKRIYMEATKFRDVEEIISDYYLIPRETWIAKYQTRFYQRDK